MITREKLVTRNSTYYLSGSICFPPMPTFNATSLYQCAFIFLTSWMSLRPNRLEVVHDEQDFCWALYVKDICNHNQSICRVFQLPHRVWILLESRRIASVRSRMCGEIYGEGLKFGCRSLGSILAVSRIDRVVLQFWLVFSCFKGCLFCCMCCV